MSEFMHHLLPEAETQVRSMLGQGVGSVHHHHWHIKGGDLFGDMGRAFSPHGAIAKSFTPEKLKKAGKTLSRYALPSAASALGGAAGSALSGSPVGGVVGATLGSMAGKVADEKIQGLGLKRGRKRKATMEGEGWLDKSGLLDKKFSTRDIIQGAKKLPGLVKEGVADIKGGSLKPKRFVKGSEEARAFMKSLREMRKKK